MLFTCRNRTYDLSKKALLVGILNVTPDSFSDGGAFLDPSNACKQGLQLLAEEADILDIGGESVRPGALPIDADEELRRVIPVIEALRKQTDAPLSIDTSKASVAKAAIAAGVDIVNDVTALEDPLMGPLVATSKVGLILMHKQGTPRTMQDAPSYPDNDVLTAVTTFLLEARQRAEAYGVAATSIILDPGVCFGKTFQHTFSLLAHLSDLANLGSPLMLGHSRKSLLEATTGSTNPEDKLHASLGFTALARAAGVLLFRVHDPKPHKQALKAAEMLLS